MSSARIILGKTGEKAAAKHLRKNGHKILAENYKNRSGEIDLITRHRDTTVFVEVKTRKTISHGSALAAVTVRKQKQISKVALEYLSNKNLLETDARFDVVSVQFEENGKCIIEHLENAFDLCYGF